MIDELTVAQNVEIGLAYRGFPAGERCTRIDAALEQGGMSHRARKAIGADTRAIVTLLVWQFATRVDLPLGLGAAALAGSVTIALATVGAHIFVAARARPARSLRDE